MSQQQKNGSGGITILQTAMIGLLAAIVVGLFVTWWFSEDNKALTRPITTANTNTPGNAPAPEAKNAGNNPPAPEGGEESVKEALDVWTDGNTSLTVVPSDKPGRFEIYQDGKELKPIWHLEPANDTEKAKTHQALITTAKFSPNGSRLVTVDIDGKVLLWNVSKGAIEKDRAWVNAWPVAQIGKNDGWSILEYTEGKDQQGLLFHTLQINDPDSNIKTLTLREDWVPKAGYILKVAEGIPQDSATPDEEGSEEG